MTAIPPMRRRIVGTALRRYREQLGYTLDDAARILDCDRSKISRIETGQRGIRRQELFELLAEYGADKQAQDVLVTIANTRGAQGWWQPYADVLPNACLDYFALEMAASRISIFGAQQVPDLLQTEQYASAVVGVQPDRSPDELQRLTDVCLIRQETVLTESRPEVAVVIGEAALRQAVGGNEVMHEQLASLADVRSKFSEVSIRMLPFTRGAHAAGAAGSFTVLRYAHEPDLGVVHLAGISGGAFLEEQQEVMAYASAFEQLEMSALSPDASAQLIRQIQAEGQLRERPEAAFKPALHDGSRRK
jgi:transcriptional regulator with XRE-family HTH domain